MNEVLAHRDILNSWKEIARYLKRGVRTVQRWERDLRLPVRRPRGKSRSPVLALRSEVDAWLDYCPQNVLEKEEPTPNPASALAAEEFNRLEKTSSKPRPITVLLVDDELVVLRVRHLLLETLGYTALTASSGEEGLDIFREGGVDIVILDYWMPGMDGEQMAREIRKLDRTIPIILSTACMDPPNAIFELVTEYVPKGLSAEYLIHALEQQAQLVRNGSPVVLRKRNRAWPIRLPDIATFRRTWPS